MAKVLEESWNLNSNDATAILSSGRHNGIVAGWADIWEYQVPSGQAHILKPSHHFSVYIDDGAGAIEAEASAGTCRLRIVVKDQSKQSKKPILGPIMYEACKDFQDIKKKAKLNLTSDQVVEELFWIVIEAYNDAAIDESDSYFQLETIRVRSSI